MCDIVWVSPQEHWSESESFHFFLQARSDLVRCGNGSGETTVVEGEQSPVIGLRGRPRDVQDRQWLAVTVSDDQVESVAVTVCRCMDSLQQVKRCQSLASEVMTLRRYTNLYIIIIIIITSSSAIAQEFVLQGWSVSAKSERQYSAYNIGLSSTIVI